LHFIECFSFMMSSSSNNELAIFVQDVANRSFLKSQVLQETVYNRKLLAEKDELIKQRWDQYLVMRNKYNDLVREHIERLMA